jgi:Ca2+-binding RTX toxin-like protein
VLDDTITGGAGADSIKAGAGDDIINGFTAGDTVDGGAGNRYAQTDRQSPWYSCDNQIVNIETIDASTAAAGVAIDLSKQTEGIKVTGSSFADTILTTTASLVGLTPSLVSSVVPLRRYHYGR